MVAAMIGQREDVFVWPGETWVLPNVAKLWAGGPPNPECRDQVLGVLHRSLKGALIDMREWNDTYAEPSFERKATADEVEDLATELTEAALSAPSSSAALRASAHILERFQRRWTDKPYVAEKTPENVLLYPDLSRALDPVWVICHREPFGVIASLQKRAGADPFAPWDNSIETCLGMYLKYGWAVVSIARSPHASISIAYEEVCATPERVMDRLSVRLGNKAPPLSRNGYVRAPHADAWQSFGPQQRWIILALTRGLREHLGYGPEAYSKSFSEIVQGASEFPDFATSPLVGVSAEPGRALRWVGKSSLYGIFCSSPVRRVEIDLYLPPGLKIDVQRLCVRDCAGRSVASAALVSGEQVTIGVDTDTICASASESGIGVAYLLELRAERVCVPYATVSGNLDERLLSLMASDFRPAGRSLSSVGR